MRSGRQVGPGELHSHGIRQTTSSLQWDFPLSLFWYGNSHCCTCFAKLLNTREFFWLILQCLYVAGMNGVHRQPPDMHQQHQSDKKRRNYKLIVDPTIHSYKGNQKVYRFDGINPVRIRLVAKGGTQSIFSFIWSAKNNQTKLVSKASSGADNAMLLDSVVKADTICVQFPWSSLLGGAFVATWCFLTNFKLETL